MYLFIYYSILISCILYYYDTYTHDTWDTIWHKNNIDKLDFKTNVSSSSVLCTVCVDFCSLPYSLPFDPQLLTLWYSFLTQLTTGLPSPYVYLQEELRRCCFLFKSRWHIPTLLTPSYLTLLYPTLPTPTLPYPYSTLPYPTLPLPYPTLLYPILPYPYPTPPYPTPTLPYPILPYPTLPYPTLPYPTLLCPILPYPTLSSSHTSTQTLNSFHPLDCAVTLSKAVDSWPQTTQWHSSHFGHYW